jgi:plasmid stability protein
MLAVNLHVKNVPPALHERLRCHARDRNRTMDEVVLAAIVHELERREWAGRLATRPETDLGVTAASLLEDARRRRPSAR